MGGVALIMVLTLPLETLKHHIPTHTSHNPPSFHTLKHTYTSIDTSVELGSVADEIAVILYKEGDPVSHTSY